MWTYSFINNIDLAIALILVTAIYFATGLLPVKQKWNRTHYIFGLMLCCYAFVAFVAVKETDNYVSEQQKEKLLGYAPSYAYVFKNLGHEKLSLNSKASDSTYLKLIEYQKQWLKVNPFVSDVYTMKKTSDGKIRFMVDSETDYDRNGVYDNDREARTQIGEIFEKSIPELELAFLGHATFTKLAYTDRWGQWVSAFVPLYDQNNHVDAVLALDFPADVFFSEIHAARSIALACITLFFLLVTTYLTTLQRQRKYNDELDAALNAAKKAAQVKSEFLANMSHEIRTPINAILGMISLLTNENLSTDIKRKLKIIKICSDNLVTLINDILDFSKIEAGKLTLELTPVNLEESVKEIFELMRPTAEEKGLRLYFKHEKFENPQWVETDVTRFRQVLLNLVTNAIKFTAQGSVTIKLEVKDAASNRIEAKVSVIDTGIGIDTESQKKLFQTFSQVDASTTRRFGGTGLGLAICMGIVQQLNGKIWVESALKRGSTFSFCFLANKCLAPQINSTEVKLSLIPKMAKTHPLKILIADDQMPNRLLATHFLESLGYVADSVCNGLEALDAFNTKFYDVVFMDCQMPEMDGYLATKKIKSRFTPEKCPWIIALTASVFPEDREKCIKSGMNDFVTKPFNAESLARALANVKVTRPSSVENDRKRNTGDITSVIDLNLIQRHFKGDEAILERIINDFQANFPSQLNQLAAGVEAKDFSQVRLIAHKLRGNVSNFFAQSAQDYLYQLEACAKQKNLAEAPQLIKKINEQLDQLNKCLADLKTRKVA